MSCNISGLVSAIQLGLNEGKFFTFSQQESQIDVTTKKMDHDQALDGINHLVSFAREKLQSKTLRQLSLEDRESLRDLVDVTYRACKVFAKTFSKSATASIQQLQLEALQLKLGGRVSKELLSAEDYRDFRRFIEINNLQHKMQALGHQMTFIPSLSFEGLDGSVDWTKLRCERVPATTDRGVIKKFYLEDRLLFETDEDLKLTDNFTYLDGKISAYNSWTDPKLRAYDHEAPCPGRFKVELWTSLGDASGKSPAMCLGDHSFLVLVSETGERIGVGKLGFGFLGLSEGYIESPDRYLLLPKNNYSFKKTEILINKAQFVSLLSSIEEAKKRPISFAILNDNCTSFASQLLSKINLKVDSQMHLLEVFIRKVLPKTMVDYLLSSLKKIPISIRKVLCFLPVVYIPSCLSGIFFRFFRFKLWVNNPKELNVFDIIFRPWNVVVNHPFAIRKWQTNHPDLINLTNI